jgi:hypothetical protein
MLNDLPTHEMMMKISLVLIFVYISRKNLTATAGRKIFLSFTFADMQQELFWRYEIL